VRFLVDECAGPTVARWLREQGYDAFSVFEEARGVDDEWVINRALEDDRILITADKDFGEKVFREGHAHRGIVLLRLEDERAASKIAILQRLLRSHAALLPGRFVVATETKVRIARTDGDRADRR
jgi:predicted nuclease of predicted toxin-antitoxin system